MFDPVLGAAESVFPSGTPDQLAAAIARTMAATNPAALMRNGITQEITSHGDVVESRLTFETAGAFQRAAAGRSDARATFTRFICGESRLPYIQKGVVFHNIYVGPASSDTFDFIVDAKACASQANNVEAGSEAKVVEAQKVARQLQASLSSDRPIAGLHLDGVRATAETVDVAYTVTSLAMAEHLRNKDFEVRGITQGWMCGTIGAAIRKGVRINVLYRGNDGSSLLAFSVGSSMC